MYGAFPAERRRPRGADAGRVRGALGHPPMDSPFTRVFRHVRRTGRENINGIWMDTYHRWMEVVIGGTLAGVPVVNVPVARLISPGRCPVASVS